MNAQFWKPIPHDSLHDETHPDSPKESNFDTICVKLYSWPATKAVSYLQYKYTLQVNKTILNIRSTIRILKLVLLLFLCEMYTISILS